MECPKHSLHAHVGLMWPGPGWCIYWFQVRYSSFVCHALRDLVTTWPNRPLFLPHGRKVWTGICWRLVLLCVWVVYEGWTCLLFARPEHTEGIKSEPAFVDSRLVVLLVGKSELAFAEGLVLMCVLGSLWRLTARCCSCAWVHSTRQTMSLSSMPSVCTRRPEHTLRKNWHLLIQGYYSMTHGVILSRDYFQGWPRDIVLVQYAFYPGMTGFSWSKALMHLSWQTCTDLGMA